MAWFPPHLFLRPLCRRMPGAGCNLHPSPPDVRRQPAMLFMGMFNACGCGRWGNYSRAGQGEEERKGNYSAAAASEGGADPARWGADPAWVACPKMSTQRGRGSRILALGESGILLPRGEEGWRRCEGRWKGWRRCGRDGGDGLEGDKGMEGHGAGGGGWDTGLSRQPPVGMIRRNKA